MSELADMHCETSEDAWRVDCPKASLVQPSKPRTGSKENIFDLNGIPEDFQHCDIKRTVSASDPVCKEAGAACSEDGNIASQKDCAGCKSCHCRGSGAAIKRKCSASDFTFNVSDIFANPNTIPLKRNLLAGSGGVKSTEKIEKINLANLVFNPNFKNSAGCVNLPVIRAGQNLGQKNAQRTALNAAKDAIKDATANASTDINSLTQQAPIDLLAQQLQPQSLNKLNAKLQLLSQQRSVATGLNVGSNPELNLQSDPADVLQNLAAAKLQQQQSSTQSSALRYKTELCRSYEEGGECRFGTACTFAHGPEELRPVPRHPLYKTEFCRTYHQHGYCQYGTRCHFIHDADEADKNAPLKGCKTWGRHDQLSGALLSLASSSGLLEHDHPPQSGSAAESAKNDVLLANLRRLYALRMMTSQEKPEQSANNQFSVSQPMAHQLAMAHQQLSGGHGHLPLSMTQPLPMEALQLGLQRAGQIPHMAQRGPQLGHVAHNRVESLATDYSGWGMTPPSPTYSGISPFGNYQQFSPLPHHHPHQAAAQSAYHYPFSATAPDLSAALSVSPYGVSPQGFANTVNVGHLLPDQNGNYQTMPASMNTNPGIQKSSNIPINAQPMTGSQGVHPAAMHGGNPIWPPTSAEVSSVIDKELFGFGLDSQSQQPGSYNQHYQLFQSLNQQQQSTQKSQQVPPHQLLGQDHAKPASSSSGVQLKSRQNDVDLLNLINSDKYATSKDSRGTMRTITESDESRDQPSVRPKLKRSIE